MFSIILSADSLIEVSMGKPVQTSLDTALWSIMVITNGSNFMYDFTDSFYLLLLYLYNLHDRITIKYNFKEILTSFS